MAALLCAACFAMAAENANKSSFKVGLTAIGNYIGIWNLDNDVYVKKETEADTSGHAITNSYYEQWLSGGHELRGVGGSFGVTGIKEVNRWLDLHLDLLVSMRYRFVEAKEHHYETTEEIIDGKSQGQVKETGSKGKYDISLRYWHIDMPTNARFKLPNEYFVESGFFLSYIVAANLKIKLISLDFNSYAAGPEIGLNAGFGKTFKFSNGRSLDSFVRFIFGLTPLLNDKVKEYLCEQIYPREWLVQAGVTLYTF